MKKPISLSDLPACPAVYALYGGNGRGYVAYIGIAKNLRQRIDQHLIKRDSSVATGASAVCLNPDQVTAVEWWESSEFGDRSKLEAAELVAFDILNPALRSRGNVTDKAKLFSRSSEFVEKMTALFRGGPAGRWVVPTLAAALERIEVLEERLAAVEKQLTGKTTVAGSV